MVKQKYKEQVAADKVMESQVPPLNVDFDLLDEEEISCETGQRKAAEAKAGREKWAPIDFSYERGRQQGGDQHEQEDGEAGQLGLEGHPGLLQDEVGVGEDGVDPAQLVGEADGKHVEDQLYGHRVAWDRNRSIRDHLCLQKHLLIA